MMREHPGKLKTKPVPGAPRTGTRVSPGVVPRPRTKPTGAGTPLPGRYARLERRIAGKLAKYGGK